MNNKERLEEIKLKFNNTIDAMLEDVKFLIEQAERAYELEEEKIDDEHFVAELLEQTKRYFVTELFEQNRRYRAALEFYADRDNYEPDHYDPDAHDYTSMIARDKGATARKALEE